MKLKKDLIHQIIKLIDHSLQVKIGLIKDELSGNIMTEYVALKTKTYSYLMEDGTAGKKGKSNKKCVMK